MATIKPQIYKELLADIDLSTYVVTDIQNLPDGSGQVDITIEDDLTPRTRNPVTGRAIWYKLSTLSGDIENKAYSHDLSLMYDITPNGSWPVPSLTIYSFCKRLSNDIIEHIPEQEIDTTYLIDKRYGGEVSGDLGLYQHDFYNLSGNYVQSNSGNKVLNISDRNTFLQAESETIYGPSYTGTYGYCIVELISDNQIRLSGDISQLYDFFYFDQLSDYQEVATNHRALSTWMFGNDTSSLKNALFSISLGQYSGSMRLKIKSVDPETGIVTFANNDLKVISIVKETRDFRDFTEADYINLYYNDDNAFYCVGFPHLGNLKIKNFYGQHAEGGSIRAIQKYTHAEGRDNIADVRYAHVEGSHNAAGDMAAHAEGFRTFAAKRFSHAEGEATKAMGDRSHAAGVGATALSSRSWVWNGRITGATYDFDTYVQPAGSGNGAFCINPQNGINGFYIGNQSLGTILNNYQPSGGGSGSSGNVFVPDSYKSFDTHKLVDQIYNNGNSFEDSPTVHAFLNSGQNKWAYVNDNTNVFYGKIIKVNPGDVVTYIKKPYDRKSSYYTTYMRALSSFDATNVIEGEKAPLDSNVSVLTVNDESVVSCWNSKSSSHQFYPQNGIWANKEHTQWSDDWTGNNDDKLWYNARKYFSNTLLGLNADTTTKLYPHELLSCQPEVTVKIPANTEYLYICTKYFGAPQDLESFKINGYELISDKNKEKSTTINAFNVDSDLNIRRNSLTYNKNVGYYGVLNNNYMITHPIPCKTGDRILVSTKPYDRGPSATNARYIYIRSIEYLDKNFNRLSCSVAADVNNGFNANALMKYHENMDDERKTLELVNSGVVQVENCEYVRIGIVDPTLGNVNNNEPIIQIVHSKDYPKYTPKEHQYYVPFVKDYYPQLTDAPLIPKLVGKKLVFFGDSLTRNSLASEFDHPNYGKNNINIGSKCDWQFTKGYVQFVSEALKCDYVNAGNGGDTAALSSVAGENTRNSLADRLNRWDADGFNDEVATNIPKADAVFVMIGTNDWAYSWTEFGDVNLDDKTTDNFCGSIRMIIDKLQQITNRRCPIIFCTPIKRKQQDDRIDYTQTNDVGKTLADYCNAIKTICERSQNAYCIDLYNICKIDPLNEEIKAKYIPDGTHPTTLGHEVMAKGILFKLPEIMKKFYKEISPVDSMIDTADTTIANALMSAGISANTPIESLTLGDVLTMTHNLQTTL